MLTAPSLDTFGHFLEGSDERKVSTTMAVVSILRQLMKDETIGKYIVPIVPDEARTFGMDGLFKVNGIPTIPFYIFYSMFGFQRVGDMIWSCADMMCRGFLLGGTAGRTTLNGESLQHQDGHSHVLASTVPNLKS